jgi:hypothetical protein
MPSSWDDSSRPYVDVERCREWQEEESLGSSSTWTAQAFSRFGVAWSWEGRSTVKLPYSSVIPNAELAAWLEPADSHVTATFAPGSENEIHTLSIISRWKWLWYIWLLEKHSTLLHAPLIRYCLPPSHVNLSFFNFLIYKFSLFYYWVKRQFFAEKCWNYQSYSTNFVNWHFCYLANYSEFPTSCT